jgi:hypothetical protein
MTFLRKKTSVTRIMINGSHNCMIPFLSVSIAYHFHRTGSPLCPARSKTAWNKQATGSEGRME